VLDREVNPYTPNAGAMPTALAGRDEYRDQFGLLLRRLQRGYTEKSMILTGLRGVGKTVLLNDFARQARTAGWRVIEIEIPRHDNDNWFRKQVAQGTRRALLSLSTPDRWRDRVRTALSVLKNFSISVDPDGKLTAGLDIKPVLGLGDADDLVHDMTDLFVSLGEAAQEEGTGVVFLVDGIQFLSALQLESLIMALHKTVQRALPVTMVGAGLPQIAKLSGDAKSYAERLFQFREIGALPDIDAQTALRAPAERERVSFTPDALTKCVEITEGYPYFIQEIGYAVWRVAAGTPITKRDVELAESDYISRLDESFFRVRLDRATPLEKSYMKAMSELGPNPHTAGDVAKLLGRTTQQLGGVRKGLIEKGLLYSPSDYGLAQFTVPQFDRFIMRTIPDLDVPPLRPRQKRN